MTNDKTTNNKPANDYKMTNDKMTNNKPTNDKITTYRSPKMLSMTPSIITLVLLFPMVITWLGLVIATVYNCGSCDHEESCDSCDVLPITGVAAGYYGLLMLINFVSLGENIDVQSYKIYNSGRKAKYSRCSYIFTVALLTPIISFYIVVLLYSLTLQCVSGVVHVFDLILPCKAPVIVAGTALSYHLIIMILAIVSVIKVQRIQNVTERYYVESDIIRNSLRDRIGADKSELQSIIKAY